MNLPIALIFVLPPSHKADWVEMRYRALMRILVDEIRILTGIRDSRTFSMHAATVKSHSDIAAEAMASQISVSQFQKDLVKLTNGDIPINMMLRGIPDDKIPIFVTPWALQYATMLMKTEVLKDCPLEYTEPPVSSGPEGVGQALIVVPGMKLLKLVSI